MIYLAIGYQVVTALILLILNILEIYNSSSLKDRGMIIESPTLLYLTWFLFIPLVALIGTIYFLFAKEKNKIAAYLVMLNTIGAVIFIIWFLNFLSQGTIALFAAPVIIIIFPVFVLPAFIWGYMSGKSFSK